MADHTVSLNASQENRLARAVTHENRRRAEMVSPLPPVTADQYLAAKVSDAIDDSILRGEDREATLIRQAFAVANQAAKDSVKTTLGVT